MEPGWGGEDQTCATQTRESTSEKEPDRGHPWADGRLQVRAAPGPTKGPQGAPGGCEGARPARLAPGAPDAPGQPDADAVAPPLAPASPQRPRRAPSPDTGPVPATRGCQRAAERRASVAGRATPGETGRRDWWRGAWSASAPRRAGTRSGTRRRRGSGGRCRGRPGSPSRHWRHHSRGRPGTNDPSGPPGPSRGRSQRTARA